MLFSYQTFINHPGIFFANLTQNYNTIEKFLGSEILIINWEQNSDKNKSAIVNIIAKLNYTKLDVNNGMEKT